MRHLGADPLSFEHDWTIGYEQAAIHDELVYRFPVSASAGEWTATFEDESGFYRARRGVIQVFFCLAPTRASDWRRIAGVFKALEPMAARSNIEATIALRGDRMRVWSRWLPEHVAIPIGELTQAGLDRALSALIAAETEHGSDS